MPADPTVTRPSLTKIARADLLPASQATTTVIGNDPFDLEPTTSLALTMPSGSHVCSQVLDTPKTRQVMREVSERRQRRQPAGAMHTIAVVHALLGIASLLAHRRCLIDSSVRSHARLRRQHSCDLPTNRLRDFRKGWGWLEASIARAP